MKTKTPYAQAAQVAAELVEELGPHCERIEVAGSIRRKCPTVGDIEIVAIPRPYVDLFGEPIGRTYVDDWIDSLPDSPMKNGPRMKQFNRAGYQVDLFLATPENFGWILLLRTGSAEFSHKMTTATPWGYKPVNVTLADGRVYMAGRLVPVAEEAEIWRLWGMVPIVPEEREVTA